MQGMNPCPLEANQRKGWSVRLEGGVRSTTGTHTCALIAQEDDLTLAFVKVMARFLSILVLASDAGVPTGCKLTSCELEVMKWD